MKKGYGSSEPIDEENDYEMDESDLVSHHYVHNSTWRTKLTLFIVVTVVVIFLVAGSTNKLSMTFLSFFDESSARGVTIIASSTKTSNVDVAVADDEPRSTTVGGDNFTSSTFTVVDEATTVEKNSFRFTLVRSGYDPISYFSTSASEFLNYKVLQGYSAVLEPYANMNLYLLDGTDLNARYDYTVCKLNSEVEECYEGAATYDGGAADVSVSVACTPYDEYSVSVSEIDLDTGSEVATGYINALCLYVRRDIEFLSETDLSNTMDAMYKLWDLTDDEGQELYGSDFHSSVYFLEAHFFNAAMQNSDHIHEGLGFLPQHIKFSNWFEKSLQSIDPSISLPYWEFTRENALNVSIIKSFMFTESTFGSLSIPKDTTWGFTYENDVISAGNIQDGRWANTKATVNTRFADIPSSYGYLRSPWNINPSPYVTRFASDAIPLPSCSQYYEALNTDYTMSFVDAIQKGPHASVHASLGNVFGCDTLVPMLELGLLNEGNALMNLCGQWSYYMKDLYRDNYLKPKVGCTTDDFDSNPNNIQCGYECDSSQNANTTAAIKELLSRGFVPDTLTDDDWETWREFVCTGDGYKIIVGTHMESASSSDPSFWPVHPTQERLLHARIMSTGAETFDWADDPVNDYVCDNAQCYVSEKGTKDYHDVCCYGHFVYDQLLDFVSANASAYYGPTNYEIMLATNPILSEYSMPYIYDNFFYAHCADVGVDDLLEDLFEKSIRNAADSTSVSGLVLSGDFETTGSSVVPGTMDVPSDISEPSSPSDPTDPSAPSDPTDPSSTSDVDFSDPSAPSDMSDTSPADPNQPSDLTDPNDITDFSDRQDGQTDAGIVGGVVVALSDRKLRTSRAEAEH